VKPSIDRGFDPHAVNWEPTDAMGEA
jgi:hypothetical protein